LGSQPRLKHENGGKPTKYLELNTLPQVWGRARK